MAVGGEEAAWGWSGGGRLVGFFVVRVDGGIGRRWDGTEGGG